MFHPSGTAARWGDLDIFAQLGNAGSEVARASRAKAQGNRERQELALGRALELLDLTLADPRWRGGRRREIARARELVCDFIVGENEYGSTAESIDAWFMAFAMAARRGH